MAVIAMIFPAKSCKRLWALHSGGNFYFFVSSGGQHKAWCAEIVASVSPSCERIDARSAISSALFPSAMQQARLDMEITNSQDCIWITSWQIMRFRSEIECRIRQNGPFRRQKNNSQRKRIRLLRSISIGSYFSKILVIPPPAQRIPQSLLWIKN